MSQTPRPPALPGTPPPQARSPRAHRPTRRRSWSRVPNEAHDRGYGPVMSPGGRSRTGGSEGRATEDRRHNRGVSARHLNEEHRRRERSDHLRADRRFLRARGSWPARVRGGGGGCLYVGVCWRGGPGRSGDRDSAGSRRAGVTAHRGMCSECAASRRQHRRTGESANECALLYGCIGVAHCTLPRLRSRSRPMCSECAGLCKGRCTLSIGGLLACGGSWDKGVWRPVTVAGQFLHETLVHGHREVGRG